MMDIALIHDGGQAIITATLDGDALRVTGDTLAAALGWKLDGPGLCYGDACVPVRDAAALVTADGIDLAGLARAIGRPFVFEPQGSIAVLGAHAADRADRLASLEAPDFTLPDLAGRLHSLSDHRGKKR